MDYPEPTYLSGLVSRVHEEHTLSRIEQDYGEDITVFSAGRFARLSQTWSDEYDEGTGTIYGEKSNGETLLLFDVSRHGYDGIMGLYPDDGEPAPLRTTELPADAEVLLVFQYTPGEEDYMEDEGPSPHVQDYFAWIALYIRSGDTLTLYEDFETQ